MLKNFSSLFPIVSENSDLSHSIIRDKQTSNSIYSCSYTLDFVSEKNHDLIIFLRRLFRSIQSAILNADARFYCRT